MPTNVRAKETSHLYRQVVQLPVGSVEGTFTIRSPFPTTYLGILNSTPATVYVAEGQRGSQPADALPWGPGANMAVPVHENSVFTLWWSSPTPITNLLNTLVFLAGDEPIALASSPVSQAIGQNMHITGIVDVDVTSPLPAGTNEIGTVGVVGTVDVDVTSPLPAGTNQIGTVGVVGTVDVDVTSPLPAGTNEIGTVGVVGTVDVDVTSPLPAGTNQIGTVGLAAVNSLSAALVSTTTALGAAGVYTSGSIATSGYGQIVGNVYSDQSGTAVLEQSWDGTNWDSQESTAVTAATPTTLTTPVCAPNFRVVYTNGSTAQTVFRLHVGLRGV